MWLYLSAPENTLIVHKLVEDGWGLPDLSTVVELHRRSVSFAWIENDVVVSLANVERQSNTTYNFRYWLNPDFRGRNIKRKMIRIFLEFVEFARKDLGIQNLVVYTERTSIIRLVKRYGARYIGYIRDAYGDGRDGHMAVWESR